MASLWEKLKKAKKKIGGIKLDKGLKKIVSSVGMGGLQVGAAIQSKLPKEVVSPATTFTKILTEKPKLTPMGLAKSIFKGPRLALEGMNIVTGGVEAGVRGLAERTPLKKVKGKIPKTNIELTAPGVLGFAASMAVPLPGGAKVKGVSKIAKMTKVEKIAAELTKMKGLKITAKEIPTLAKKLVKPKTTQEVSEIINKFVTRAKPAKVVAQATKGVEGVTQKGIQRAVGKLTPEGLPIQPQPSLAALEKPVQELLPKVGEAVPPPAGNVPSAIAPLEGIVPQVGKERGFITTAKEAAVTAPEVKATIQGTYTPITNVKTLEDAQMFVTANGVDAARTAVTEAPWSAETNLVGQELARVAQNAGRFDEAGSIIEELSRKGTQAGQGNQAFAVWSNLTPEGMIRYAQKSMAEGSKKLDMVTKAVRAVMRKPEIKLTPADTEYISNMMKQANAAATEEEKAILVRKVWEYIGKKMPWGASDLLDEYRYNNMLSNPLTHIRNAWSNVIQTLITRPATLAAQGKPLKAMSYELGALKNLPKGVVDFFKATKEGATFGKMDITRLSKAGPIKPKRLGIYNLPSNLMEGGDKFFRAMIEGGEMATGTTAEEARQIAEYSLFRSDLFPAGQGVLLNKVDELTKAAYGLRSVGLGWFIPFIRTPMNVAKQWIEYSPMGITTALGAAKPKEQLAKAMLGSIATVIGANMAMEGRTTWAPPSDATARKLFYDSGRKPYSVKIGNKWVPLQTTGVFAWALGLPAAVKYYQEEAPKAFTDTNMDKLGAMIASPLGFWTDQTFVSGLGSFVKLAQGDIDWNFARTVGYTASQIKPFNGLLRYVTNVMDPVFRKPKTIEQQLVSDIPGMTKNLPFYETSTGEPARRDISNFFTPYAMGTENQQFEEPYQQRLYKLQYNAIMRQVDNKEITEEEAQEKIRRLLPNLQLPETKKPSGPSLQLFR